MSAEDDLIAAAVERVVASDQWTQWPSLTGTAVTSILRSSGLAEEVLRLREERALLLKIMDLAARTVTWALADPKLADNKITQAAYATMQQWRAKYGTQALASLSSPEANE